MSFDPTLPTDGMYAAAQILRNQLNGLKSLIDAVPAGPMGPAGPQGPPFAQAVVDAVITLSPFDNAQVSVSFDGINLHFTFSIPRGVDGQTGAAGEVTTNDMNNAITNAINGCSANSNGVSTLATNFSDPEVNTVAAKLDELITALRR